MFDLGDNLSVEPARIPWLIWIQLLVTFLLILFLYLLTFFTLDPSHPKTTHSSFSSSSASPSTPPFLSPNSPPLPKPRTSIGVSNTSLITQVGEQGNAKGDISTSPRKRIIGGGEDIFERESPWPMYAYFHPCNYFRLARITFLKCFGLESTTGNLASGRNKSKKHRERTKES